MANDIYVEILNYVKDSDSGQVSLRQLKEAFPDQWNLIDREVQNNRLLSPLDGGWNLDNRFSLSFEDYFRLMEHQELIEARKSAKNAMFVAVTSIFFNILALIFSIVERYI